MKNIVITDKEIAQMVADRKREIRQQLEKEKFNKSLQRLINRAEGKDLRLAYTTYGFRFLIKP